MTPGAIAALIAFALLIAGIAYAIWTAPEGYQDSQGWHAGVGVDEWEDGV